MISLQFPSRSVQASVVLTNDKPQTHYRRNDQENVRDNSVPLLPTSQSDPDSQADQRVCESEQYPFHSLFDNVRNDVLRVEGIGFTMTASPEMPMTDCV